MRTDEPGGGKSVNESATPAVERRVELLVARDGDVWELRCGHCGKIERYASEKEAVDAAGDHSRSLGVNEEPHLRVDEAD
jgi:hypothetical protein